MGKIQGTIYDRRRKLTEEQKQEIRRIREADGMSQAALAQMFGVSKRLVQLILDPEKEKIAKQRYAERAKDGRYAKSKAEAAAIYREYKERRQTLISEGKI